MLFINFEINITTHKKDQSHHFDPLFIVLFNIHYWIEIKDLTHAKWYQCAQQLLHLF